MSFRAMADKLASETLPSYSYASRTDMHTVDRFLRCWHAVDSNSENVDVQPQHGINAKAWH